MKTLIALAFLLTPEAPLMPAYLSRIDGTTARHEECVKLIAEDIAIGRRAAEAWATEGGGAPALHCLAIADLAAGFPKLAAVRLTEIAERSDVGDKRARARLLAESALAWLDAGEHQRAENAVDEAKKIAPLLPELDFVAAKAFAEAQKWQAAADAVTAAEKAGVVSAEAFVIRARAHRALGRDQDAANDVVAALNLDPYDLDALVLRGELQQAGIAIDAYYGDADGDAVGKNP
jgi:tetratricopeptide (TPR) repeat protein